MSETEGWKSPEVSRVFSKDKLINLEYFDTNLMGDTGCGYMVLAKKPAKKWILRGWKLRELTSNQKKTPSFISGLASFNGDILIFEPMLSR